MRRLLRRLAYLVRFARHERELDEEMAFHRSMSGAGRFGNGTLAREDARAVWLWPFLESASQDLRYAARSLRRDKGFTLVAAGALAAAIGLNTSLFTAFNAVMWRPWPVPEPERVVTLVSPAGPTTFSLAEYSAFAAASSSFDGLVVSRCLDGVSDGCVVQMDDVPLNAEFVSRNYFDVLRVRLSRGAGFSAGDGPAGDAIAVLSDAAWRARFGSDPAIVGRVIRLDDVPFTLVGVADPSFTGTQFDRKDLWIPLDAMPRLRPDYGFDDTKRFGAIAGRLTAGASRTRAEAELDAISKQFHAATRLGGGSGVRLIDTTFVPGQGRRQGANSVFALMLLAVLLVLALACANVGNLLLARAVARRREVAIRLAIGASRLRIVRQLLTESLLLSAIAAGAGLAIAWRLPGVLFAQIGGPLSLRLELDTSIVIYAVGIGVVACVAFGLAPAWFASRPPGSALAFGRGSAAHARVASLPLRSILVAAQVAIAIVLLVSAALLVRGVEVMASADPGFDMHDVSVVSFQLPASYETARVRAFARRILDGGAPTNGEPWGFADTAPFGVGGRMWVTVTAAGGHAEDVLGVEASAGYFGALGIPIVQGRNFQPGDVALGGVIVNESMARQFWPNQWPIGQVAGLNGNRRVVGVAKDVRHYPFAPRAVFPTIYTPIDGRTVPQMIVRRLDARSVQAIGALAAQLEPRVRVSVAPLSRNLDARLVRSRAGAWIGSAVGTLGLLLATIGVFSVLAYTVEQRATEIGIRVALGARPTQIVRAIVAANGGAIAGGVVCGLAASAAAGRLLRSLLFGLSPLDPAAYGAVAGVIALAGLAATIYPARKATRIDPAVALRAD